MEQTSLGSSRAIMKLAFTVKWFSVLMFSWNISISGPILPSPSLTKHTNIRTYSAHWTSLRALSWMADVFSQTCKESMRVCSSDKGDMLSHSEPCMHEQCGSTEPESHFVNESDYKADYISFYLLCSLHSNTHCTPAHAGTQYKPFSWCSHERL